MTGDIRDELGLFLLAAAVAYREVAQETGQWPPESRKVQERAYSLYEAELASRKAECGEPVGDGPQHVAN